MELALQPVFESGMFIYIALSKVPGKLIPFNARLLPICQTAAVWQKNGSLAKKRGICPFKAPQTACFFGQTAELPDCHSLAESIFCSLARGTAAWQIRRPRLLYYLPDCRHLGAAWERSLQFPPHFGILSSLAALGANFPQTAAVWQF